VGTDLARRALARPDALTLTLARVAPRASLAGTLAMWVLTSPAVRSPAPTRSRHAHARPRVARSLARFQDTTAFNQPLDSWDTSRGDDMYAMWVLTSPAVRSPAPTRSRPRSLRASLARSPGSAAPLNFNQDLSGWDTSGDDHVTCGY
jgi:hypothetical protein